MLQKENHLIDIGESLVIIETLIIKISLLIIKKRIDKRIIEKIN
jgi:hypothetical protein